MPKIYIDADGCPVVYPTLDIAQAYGVDCCIICDTAHSFQIEGVETIVVDQGRDSADYKILQLLHAGDIVITQDYGLAAMALAKQAYLLSQNGLRYTNDNIEIMLSQRYLNAKQRKVSKRYPHIPKRTSEDDDTFIAALQQLLEEVL